ncbi:MAG: SpoIIE family protein phosphatase, partial [Oscillospiraceae bacterium]
MEDKRFFGIYEKVLDFLTTPFAEKAGVIIFSFFGGLLCSRGLVFGKYAPFGVALAAAVPKGGMWAAVIGASFGYLLPSPVYLSVRYIAALLAVGAIRWTLSELTKINENAFFAPLVTFLPLLATGMTMILINNSMSQTAALYVAESFLGSGCAYFFRRTAELITVRKMRGVFDSIDIACLTISLGVFILAFSEVNIAGISIGRILMILMVLLCSGAGGIAGGAISGIAAGAMAGLSGVGLSYLSGAYGLGGLMAGVFASVGKLPGAVAFILAHGVASLQLGNQEAVMSGAMEVAVATIAYMVLPRNRRLAEIFTLRRDKLSGDSLRNNIVLRLNHAAEALSNVSGSVDEISKKLAKSSAVTMNTVYNSAAGEICAGCSMRAVCWRKNKEQSIKTFAALSPALKAKGSVETLDFAEEFREHCGRVGEMRESVNKFYRNYVERETAEIRAAQVRDIAGEQFNTTSALLRDMAGEFSLYQSFDEEAAERVEEVLRKHNVFPIEVCCRIDKFGRMTVEAEMERNTRNKLNKGHFTREVSNACGRSFSPPCISFTENTCKIQMCQKPSLDVQVGMCQESASSLCGDSAVGFYDGQGHYIAMISDGMGTGGMAAVDGAMASSMTETLLKAGVGYDTALRMVNSALMSKSEEETLATLDIATLDLFTGKCEFRKAGGATTIIRRGKRSESIEEDSLPVG